MFTGPMIGLLVALSVATWVYTKTMRSSGGNTKNSLVVAGVAGLFAFFIILAVIAAIDNSI